MCEQWRLHLSVVRGGVMWWGVDGSPRSSWLEAWECAQTLQGKHRRCARWDVQVERSRLQGCYPAVARGRRGYQSPLCGSDSRCSANTSSENYARRCNAMCRQVFESSESLLNLSLHHLSSWKWRRVLPPDPASPRTFAPTRELILATPTWKGTQGASSLSAPEMPELASRWGWECVGERIGLQHPKYRWEVPSYAAVGPHSTLWQ